MSRPSTGLTKRDLGFGIAHGVNGKGSKERSSKWRDGWDDIDWRSSPFAMERIGTKLVKKYGAVSPEKFSDAPAGVVH